MLDKICELLSSYRLPCGNEDELQAAIVEVLQENGWPFLREYFLGASRDRIDFVVTDQQYSPGPLVENLLGIECKVDGSPSAVASQITRYADSPILSGLILVTTCARHARFFGSMPEVCGKPFRVVSTLQGAF